MKCKMVSQSTYEKIKRYSSYVIKWKTNQNISLIRRDGFWGGEGLALIYCRSQGIVNILNNVLIIS